MSHHEEHNHIHTHEHEHEHEHTHSHSHNESILPKCDCCEHCHHEEGGESGARKILRILIAAVLLAEALILSHFTKLPTFLPVIIYAAAYLVCGYDVLITAGKNILKKDFFDECFLMSIASIGAFAIGEFPEAVAIMIFYQLGEFLQDKAVDKSRDSIEKLMDIRPDSATVIRNGEAVVTDPGTVMEGEIIIVKPGEKIPLDGIVIEGATQLDVRALTGESLPKSAETGEEVLSGSINLDGLIKVKVTKTYFKSTACKIVELVEQASDRKAPAEQFIKKFAKVYTPVVTLLAVIVAIVPSLITGNWSVWLYRAFMFLVISCPCALVISIPLTFFGGLGVASRNGILIKGSNYLEALNELKTVVFDKTGTLTKGEFEVSDLYPARGFSDKDLLSAGAMAECYSNHPIAKAVTKAAKVSFDKDKLTDYREIPGRGVSVKAWGREIIAGNAPMMKERKIAFREENTAGTKIYVAIENIYAGCIVVNDAVKSDASEASDALHILGVNKLLMLTGDNHEIAEDVANKLDLDGYYAELLPQDKVEIFELIKKQGTGKTAFVGDGINDAPVLAGADIGIAMGAIGSDAAIEAADVVIMNDELVKIAEAVKTAKKTRRIVVENIVFALAVKLLFLILGITGVAGLWIAVVGDVGVMLLAVLNSLRMILGARK